MNKMVQERANLKSYILERPDVLAKIDLLAAANSSCLLEMARLQTELDQVSKSNIEKCETIKSLEAERTGFHSYISELDNSRDLKFAHLEEHHARQKRSIGNAHSELLLIKTELKAYQIEIKSLLVSSSNEANQVISQLLVPLKIQLQETGTHHDLDVKKLIAKEDTHAIEIQLLKELLREKYESYQP